MMASATAEGAMKADAFRQVGATLGELVSLHFRLARLELQGNLTFIAKPLALGLLCLPALIMGAVFLSTAGVLLLTKWLPLWASFGVVGLFYGFTAMVLAAAVLLKARQLFREPTQDE